ncbi:hypothetical protein FK873_gp159 [Micromonas pusilla virus SP1]|uniref:Uncharacterized protein n=1 Tax=Micromonas pusilla virus SP1 TaxID=373996 RepID=G9E6F2_MPSP1|nr:hypothetical protein FK873_gp159 [Micromonas pusilla virus SP1]AET84979.1 hypothetical protein MPXG_00181 [Micromonas pusilla virus SP1]
MIAELQVHALGDLLRVLVQLCHHVQNPLLRTHPRLPQALSVHCCSFFFISFSLLVTDLGPQSPTCPLRPPFFLIPTLPRHYHKYYTEYQ